MQQQRREAQQGREELVGTISVGVHEVKEHAAPGRGRAGERKAYTAHGNIFGTMAQPCGGP